MLPVIRTRRLILRSLCMDDAPRLQLYASDYEVSKMLTGVAHPYPEGEAAGFIELMMQLDAAVDGGQASPLRIFAIECLDSAHLGFIGCIALSSETQFTAGSVLLGYWIGAPHWGRGYSTEAVQAVLCEYVFGTLGRNEVTSGMFTDNLASWRIQEKLGFVRTGESMVFSQARNA